jgi:hypothetical protein
MMGQICSTLKDMKKACKFLDEEPNESNQLEACDFMKR